MATAFAGPDALESKPAARQLYWFYTYVYCAHLALADAAKELGWADGELLAYGSLLAEGKIVRMSGQDVKRGTFSHRHSVLFDTNTNDPYCNLDHVVEKQEPFRIFNSLLSEFGVLGALSTWCSKLCKHPITFCPAVDPVDALTSVSC